MIRWMIIGTVFVLVIGGFAWWRSAVLEDLPPPTAPVRTQPAAVPMPVEANREEILRFEEEQLRQKAAAAGVEFTTSTPEAPVTPVTPTSSAPKTAPATSSAASMGAEAVVATSTGVVATVVNVATSTAVGAMSTPTSTVATSTVAATSTPMAATSAASSSPTAVTSTTQAKSNPRQFQVDGAGFCDYNAGVSSVILSGYPLVNDVGITGSGIQSWTATRVVFIVPDSVPAGTYKATVRGVNTAGFCTASASSPSMVVVP